MTTLTLANIDFSAEPTAIFIIVFNNAAASATATSLYFRTDAP